MRILRAAPSVSLPDTFRTLSRRVAAEGAKVKGSRFPAEAAPAASAEAALAFVEAVRRREHAARHHCWAYRLGESGQTWRASDDGEPSGTGGAPILREIEGRELTGCVVVVTRYYGGTKLGAGGLARAYGDAAALVLDAAADAGAVATRTIRVPVTLGFAFADTSAAMRTAEAFDALVDGQDYTADGGALRLLVRRSQAEELAAAFIDATAGRGHVDTS